MSRFRRSARDDPGERAFVSVEDVSRVYEPYRAGRIPRAMRVFGGLGLHAGGAEDDDDDAELLDDLDEVPERHEDRRTIALDRVSFSAAAASCVAIVGAPNSGKTALMKVVAGVAPPSSGRVVVHGLVGPILDSALPLFPAYGTLARGLPTVGAFLHIPPRRIRHNLDDIFEFAGSRELRKKATATVSGKTHRELLFAMMLVLDPDIILVDSPIPKPMAERVRRRLSEFKASGGLILITGQDVESVAWIADRVITLEHGSVVHDESVDDALERVAREREPEGDRISPG
jgi:ABC-type polysaccharide/polyol phosphate transport system ATPase subunit